tara:strand:+ start:2212 stop:2421 length:210 start_codon:yes stop_codon:yes gene_type:complete
MMSENQDQNTLKTKKYFIAVKQMQYFEIDIDESDLPLTEDIFWDKYYDIGICDPDSSIEEMEEQEVIEI